MGQAILENAPRAARGLPRPRRTELAGKRVLVLGLGDTGLSIARWVARQGATVRVADTRMKPPRLDLLKTKVPAAETHCGELSLRLLEGIDLLCVSPGLPLDQPVVAHAAANGLPVCGDVELFAWALQELRRAKVLAITGTNGKTTVTALAGHLLRGAGLDTEVAGNIAPPVLDALAARLDAGKLPDAWVLELSSYQLEATWSLAPDAATMLNLSEDHLDRYASLAEYGSAKARVFRGSRVRVLNRDDPRSIAMSADQGVRITFGLGVPPTGIDLGCIEKEGAQWIAQGSTALLAVDALPIQGAHNTSNAMAAFALARAIGLPSAPLLRALTTFRGLAHRLEKVASLRGVDYYDDSKGTNVGATMAALKGIATAGSRSTLSHPVILIAGGVGKGQDFAPLAKPVADHARLVILIGEDAGRIEAALEKGVTAIRCRSLEEAVVVASQHAREGEAVLLSPACASFDMFRDYKHRGEVFASAVRALGDAHG